MSSDPEESPDQHRGFQPEPTSYVVGPPDEPESITEPGPRAELDTYESYPGRVNVRRTLMIVAIVIVVVSAITIGIIVNQIPSPPPPSPTQSVTPISGNTIAVNPAPVIEAIDLPSQHSLGPAWNASGGKLGDSMRSRFAVTPCGVLISVLSVTSTIVGYEISTGTEKWSYDLRDLTGLANPVLLDDKTMTYTSHCHMVTTVYDDQDAEAVGLSIDLTTGTVRRLSDGDVQVCAAASDNRAACRVSGKMEITDLDSNETVNVPADDVIGYSQYGDIVVAGRVVSNNGYVDPTTQNVIFGHDIHAGARNRNDPWVAYVEPNLPGGYRSGVVLRIFGPLYGEGICEIMAWDPETDLPFWHEPASLACSDFSEMKWVVTSRILIAATETRTTAFRLSDGQPAWTRDMALDYTGLSDMNFSFMTAPGVTEDYALLVGSQEGSQEVVRIEDGTRVVLLTNSPSVRALSPSMAYLAGPYESPQSMLVGCSLTEAPAGTDPIDIVWMTPIPGQPQLVWTFAIGAVMYVVYDDDTGQTWVSPLRA